MTKCFSMFTYLFEHSQSFFYVCKLTVDMVNVIIDKCKYFGVESNEILGNFPTSTYTCSSSKKGHNPALCQYSFL